MNDSPIGDRIRRKKDRKLQKHFTMTIGDENSKIINYRIKQEIYEGESLEILEIISKIKIRYPSDKSTIVKIVMEKKMIEAEVVWHHGLHEAGNYVEGFKIIKRISEKSNQV